MKRAVLFSALALALAFAASASAQQSPSQSPGKIDPAMVEATVKATWSKAPADWQGRVQQDETQRVCTLHHNAPPPAEAERIAAREKAAIVYPADGKLLGDWKKGESIAQNGRGGQFSDGPGVASGGNCYACHQLAPKEISFGTLGPPLVGYGKLRDYAPDAVKAAYEKIYDAQAVFPCSNMPRFGTNKVLTPEQIKDLVALLMDPDSPVNK
ncbi:MAG TPA: sulfur oxidation c-type cytochrome SoxX [Beijerinckiaceae bacterium]|jgi:sulfur-oxidizing protein SoxX